MRLEQGQKWVGGWVGEESGKREESWVGGESGKREDVGC